jgi:hypothetical protein
MMSRPFPADQPGSPENPSHSGCANTDARRAMPLRWVWTSYAVVAMVLIGTVGISRSDFTELDKTLHVLPNASRYDLIHDNTPGAWAAVTAESEETRLRGGGYRDWGVRLMIQGHAFMIEELCPVDVPHVHALRDEAVTELVVAFEAKHAAASESTTVVVGVADRYVSPQGGICTGCWDRFGVRLPLTTDWHSFVIPVSSLRQEGWGRPARHAADQSSLVDVAASIEGGGQFDVSLRDLRVARAVRGSR